MEDSHKLFTQTLTSFFKSVRPLLKSRKTKEEYEMCKLSETLPLEGSSYLPLVERLLSTKQLKVIELVLYYLQQLVAYGFFKLEDPSNLVLGVCNCVHEKDDKVQLQLIKTLLTIVTSGHMEVHAKTLLEAFRACYHIHITSKDLVNHSTAKATLIQLLHYVFSKMEKSSDSFDQSLVHKIVHRLLAHMVDDVELYLTKLSTFRHKQIITDSDITSNLEESKTHSDNFSVPIRAVPLVLDPDDPQYSNIHTVQGTGKFGWCVECRAPAEFYCKDLRDPVCSEQCKYQNLALHDQNSQNFASATDRLNLEDAVAVFRSICKLSLKEVTASSSAYTYKSKVLSLELVLAVMDNPGPLFSTRRQFLDVIKSDLCKSLLKNSLSSEKQIYSLSLSIIVALVSNFKDTLKAEVGVFMSEIFIKLLESTSAHFHHKTMVVEVIQRITSNPRTTLELFLNYDCNVSEQDIFGRVVDTLRKVAVSAGEVVLRRSALETLAGIMISQAHWLEKELAFSKTECEEEETRSDASEGDHFEKNKQLKTHLNAAVAKFNVSPANGLQYLANSGYLDLQSPHDIACFLKLTPGLNKSLIGEYIGSSKSVNTRVLHEFINLLNFSNVGLLEALRDFLALFRIPGESQVVDRIMEKFAEKYCKDNPGVFASPDSVFLLAFGIMMLQTDLHNPAVKQKMPLEQFRMMFSQDPSIPADMLSEIYEEVKASPFTLDEDDEERLRRDSLGKRRQEVFELESEFIFQKSQEVFRKSRSYGPYYVARDIDHLKTMFMALWHPLLATFSILLEESSDDNIWKVCLKGFLSCIKIACRFNMSLELDIFLGSLAKFTSLIYLHNQVTEKNIECMKALIELAKLEANYLRWSWIHVLKCLSKLDYLHMISFKASSSGQFSQSEVLSSVSIAPHIAPAEIDYIFSISKNLDSNGIIDFVTTLVDVSKEELWRENPQTFSLQALVNVADINMDRMRFVWGQVWHFLKHHFSAAGLHTNAHIASFAVDSLKQLAIKFLKKEELSSFNFQKEFLQPFEVIIKGSNIPQVKELVVACMRHFVITMIQDLRSGWLCVFEVLTFAAQDSSLVSIVQSTLEFIVQNHKPEPYYAELLNCLKVLVKSTIDKVSIKGIDLIKDSALEVPKQEFWATIVSILAEALTDSRYEVQSKAVEAIFESLKTNDFTPEQWQTLYEIVIPPLFRYEVQDRDWLENTCMDVLNGFISLIKDKYDSLKFLLRSHFEILEKTGKHLTESVLKVLISNMTYMSTVLNEEFGEDEWSEYFIIISHLFEASLPKELTSTSDFSIPKCIDKCVIQLYLLESVKKATRDQFAFPLHIKIQILEQIKASYTLARDLNRDIDHRNSLFSKGFLANIRALPGLFKQEKEGLSILLELFFKIPELENKADYFELIKEFLNEVLSKDQLPEQRKEEVLNLLPIISTLLIPGMKSDLKTAFAHIGTEIMSLVLIDDTLLKDQLRLLLIQSLSLMDLIHK